MSEASEVRARRLEAVVAPFIQALEAVDADKLYRQPAADEWSPMMVAAHVAEVLGYWSRQAREVVARAENNQPFGRTHDDPDRISAVERHASDRLAQVMPRLRDGLSEATATIRGIDDAGWQRTARHARRGELSVAQIVDDFLIAHVDEHTRQIRDTAQQAG